MVLTRVWLTGSALQGARFELPPSSFFLPRGVCRDGAEVVALSVDETEGAEGDLDAR